MKRQHLRHRRVARRELIVHGSLQYCWVCGLRLIHVASTRHPLYITIDHVVPLARGGTNSYDNKRLAHYICNQTKQAKLDVTPDELQQLQKFISGQLKRYMEPPWSIEDKRAVAARKRAGRVPRVHWDAVCAWADAMEEANET